jgi:hypothetical protein
MGDPMSELTPIALEAGLPTPQKPRRWRSVVLGLVIFTCGLTIGAGVTVIVVRKMIVHAITHPEELPQRITQRLRSKLSLTDEQAARIRSIIAKRQRAIQEIRREFQPRLEKELDSAEEEVAAVLGPEKAKPWRKRLDQLKRLWLPPPPDRTELPAK